MSVGRAFRVWRATPPAETADLKTLHAKIGQLELEAITQHGRPEICNTDQAAVFTSLEFTGVLKSRGFQSAWTSGATSYIRLIECGAMIQMNLQWQN